MKAAGVIRPPPVAMAGIEGDKPGGNGRMAKRARRKTDAASRRYDIYAFKPGINAFKSF